jgi:hypothetical protein
VAKPCPDRVDVDARAEQMNSGGVPHRVGADPLLERVRLVVTSGCFPPRLATTPLPLVTGRRARA